MHPSIQAVLDFFDRSHLPPHLAAVVEPFAALAAVMAVVPGPETADVRAMVAARKAGG